MPGANTIHFGDFELDVETGELRNFGRSIRLSPKPAQALLMLAQSPGRLITREALRKQLWDADTHVDFEHALNFCIREVRTAIGDDARHPRYIETLARRGYRFIAQTSTGIAVPLEAPPVAPADASRHLSAYQHYEAARKWFAQTGKVALEEARKEFKRALEILPEYALAHSGLGAACALCCLNRRHPQDLDEAQLHLTRALELDPELGEPYPWLCYVLMRKNQLEAAVQAGHRGIQLQPELVTGHYFLGLAYFVRAEVDDGQYQEAAIHLREAGRVNPHWLATWFVLSFLALTLGEYDYAVRYASRLLEVSPKPRGLPFIGAEIVLASVKLRRGDSIGARDVITLFLERLGESDHMYRDAMIAAGACLLGDIELRNGHSSAALAAYRRAWHTLQEHPRIAAYERIAARAQAGLAAAYAATGENGRAESLLARAWQSARDCEAPENNAAAAGMPDVYWTLASAWARLGDRPRAMEAITSAIRTGCRDAAWLQRDPELESLRGGEDFSALLDQVRRWPGIRFDIDEATG